MELAEKKKKIYFISGLLLVSSVFLLIIITSSPTPEEPTNNEVSLRATLKDLSIDDIMNNNASKKNVPSEDGPASGVISGSNLGNNYSNVNYEDPEAIAKVQELIRLNEANMQAGVIDIENERNGVIISSEEKETKHSSSISGNLGARTKTEKTSAQVDSSKQVVVTKVVPEKRSPFNTVAFGGRSSKNAIKAYVHSEQTVSDGYTLKMRIAEDCYTDDGVFVPKNTLVHGIVRMADERVMVDIKSININGNILPFKKDVYSKDAIKGIAAPGNAKAEANKDVVGGALDGLPSSVPGLDAATQIAGAVASSAVSAGKQAVTKHVKKEKITIKTNYEIFLRPEEN